MEVDALSEARHLTLDQVEPASRVRSILAPQLPAHQEPPTYSEDWVHLHAHHRPPWPKQAVNGRTKHEPQRWKPRATQLQPCDRFQMRHRYAPQFCQDNIALSMSAIKKTTGVQRP